MKALVSFFSFLDSYTYIPGHDTQHVYFIPEIYGLTMNGLQVSEFLHTE